jgi:hypothetical protein
MLGQMVLKQHFNLKDIPLLIGYFLKPCAGIIPLNLRLKVSYIVP